MAWQYDYNKMMESCKKSSLYKELMSSNVSFVGEIKAGQYPKAVPTAEIIDYPLGKRKMLTCLELITQ